MTSWQEATSLVAALVGFMALNLGTLKWLFERHELSLTAQISSLKREGTDFAHGVEREMLKLKARLPLEYVRREDWIRFSSTLDAKFDAMRAEVREEIAELNHRIAARIGGI
jgi:hypothetical protein